MGKKKSGKVLLVAALLAWVFVVRFLTACSVEKDDLKKVRDLEFTVVGETDLPEELKQVIGEKKTAPFKMTYTDDQNLYIAVGYGEQENGGYSISVRELYLTENGRYGASGTGERGTDRSRKIVSVHCRKNRISGGTGYIPVIY